jgi:hypothetical protein
MMYAALFAVMMTVIAWRLWRLEKCMWMAMERSEVCTEDLMTMQRSMTRVLDRVTWLEMMMMSARRHDARSDNASECTMSPKDKVMRWRSSKHGNMFRSCESM